MSSGFWLGESERDRVLTEWIDSTPGAGAVIKAIVYAAITGGGLSTQTL